MASSDEAARDGIETEESIRRKKDLEEYEETRAHLISQLPQVRADAEKLAKTDPGRAAGMIQTAYLRAYKPFPH